MIDIKLQNGQGLALSEINGDLSFVNDSYVILQSAQNRCLAKKGTWMYDDSFGNALQENIKNLSAYKVSDDFVFQHISDALAPMIEDGRIVKVISAKVISVENASSIIIEIQLELPSIIGVLSYNLTY